MKISFLGTRRASGGDTGIKVLPKTKSGFKKAELIDIDNRPMLKKDFLKKYPKIAQKYIGKKSMPTKRTMPKVKTSALGKTINQLFKFK